MSYGLVQNINISTSQFWRNILLLPVQLRGGVQTLAVQVLQITFVPGHEITCCKCSGYIPFTLWRRSAVNSSLSNLGPSGSASNSGSGQDPTRKEDFVPVGVQKEMDFLFSDANAYKLDILDVNYCLLNALHLIGFNNCVFHLN